MIKAFIEGVTDPFLWKTLGGAAVMVGFGLGCIAAGIGVGHLGVLLARMREKKG